MKVLITGICGFTGSTVARALQDLDPTIELFGIDNFIRPGSERNRGPLQSAGVRLYHGDVRHASDLESLPGADWVIDAAAISERAFGSRRQIEQPPSRRT